MNVCVGLQKVKYFNFAWKKDLIWTDAATGHLCCGQDTLNFSCDMLKKSHSEGFERVRGN